MKSILLTVLSLAFALITSAQTVKPQFTAPDTVCVNTPFNVTNTSTDASSYYWSFCSADLNQEPELENLGGFSGSFNQPVFFEYVFTNNNYYGFVVNYRGGNLIRLDFGNSLLNTPVPYNLGNFDGILPSDVGAEGIQVIQNEGKWYAIIVSGYPPSGSSPKIVRIAFGPDIENPTPIATDWGNLGNMYQPIDLQIFNENNVWYGFTVNAENNTITRFNFTNSFENTPTADNLSNIGDLAYPTGLFAMNDNGTWRLFVTNAGDNTRIGGEFSITRLDFGNSLTNLPTGTNLGNLGHTLGHPRDLTIIKSCDEIIGFVINGHPGYNNIVKLNFNNDLSSQPSATTLSFNSLAFPHSISKLFRVNEDVYGFITDAQNNTISRISFKGCTNASIPSSSLFTPPPLSYDLAGIYNINLTVDIGLPTQSSFCKQVVVKNCFDSIITTNDTGICAGSQLTLHTVPAKHYSWSPALYLDDVNSPSPTTNTPTDITYYVDATIDDLGTIVRDSIHVRVIKTSVTAGNDTAICPGVTVQLHARGGNSFLWSPINSLSDPAIADPLAKPATATEYIVEATDEYGCSAKDSVLITIKPSPLTHVTEDAVVCRDASIQLSASGGMQYQWTPQAGLNNASISNPVAVVTTPINYKVLVTGSNGCTAIDSVQFGVIPYPSFAATAPGHICSGTQITLSASGGDSYAWTPATDVADATSPTTVSSPQTNTMYNVHISSNTCNYDTSIALKVNVHTMPELSALPNAFTPNGDGKNDCFGIQQWGNADIKQFTVYNRWGQVVFRTLSASQCWDGTLNGVRQQSGLYVYIIRATTVCGLIDRKGTVMLLR